MRILLIHQFFLEKDDGGGSRFNEMTRVWAAAGHEVTVLAGMVHYKTGKKRDRYKGRYTLVDEFDRGVTVIRCHVSQAYNRSYAGRSWAYLSYMFSSLYAGLFKAHRKYDVLIVTSPPLFVALTGYLLGRLRRVPLVFEVRDLWPESAVETGVLTNRLLIRISYGIERFIYRKSRLISVLTPAFRERLIEKGVQPEKIILVPNGADFSIVESALKNFDREAFRGKHDWSDKLVVTYVGAHGLANHLVQVLDAAERLADYRRVHFALIGSGMEKPELVRQANLRGLNNVEFIDEMPKSEIFKYIAASDLGTSILKKVETFKTVYSNKTFDYMACKRPVLMLIDGASRQLVEEAQCGLYVEPENPDDFADKIRYYLDGGEELRRVHGEAGYAYAKVHFDREVIANRYLQHLEALAE